MQKKHIFSLTQLMLLLAAVFTLAISTIAWVILSNTSRMMDEHIQEIGHSAVTTSGQLIDQTLLSIDQYIFDFMYDDPALLELNTSQDPLTLYTAKNDANTLLKRMGRLYAVDGILIYSPEGIKAEQIIYSSNPRLLKQNTSIAKELVQSLETSENENPLSNSEWFLQEFDSSWWLVRIILLHDTYCCVWINESQLTGLFAPSEHKIKGDFFLSDSFETEKDPSVSQAAKNHHMQYTSTAGNFLLCLNADFSEIDTKRISTVIMLVLAFTLLIFILLSFGYQLLYLPFKRFNHTMARIQHGDMETRADTPVYIREFYEMYRLFNQLMDDIQNLKLSIYENQLDKQRVEQQFLHIQVRNHFFLNCLNIIYSLAQVEDYTLIQQMTLYLVSYFRHISQDALEGVPLQEEVAHVRDYISIQEIRFPGRIVFHCDMDETLTGFRVPSLILLTFIENCILHAQIPGQTVSRIILELHTVSFEDKAGLHIRISDNGQGFSAEQLDVMNHTETKLPFGEIHGIGIHNIRNRLHLLYGTRAQIWFSNQKDGGALIELKLPPWKDQTQE